MNENPNTIALQFNKVNYTIMCNIDTLLFEQYLNNYERVLHQIKDVRKL